MLKKMFFIGWIFIVIFIFSFSFFEVEKMSASKEESLIGLTINGSNTIHFPSKDSGYAIESILCDKGSNGVWDYENWGLKIRNITQSRTKCQINFVSKYSEGILNGTDPVLKEGLIPVMIDDNGIVHKASLGWEWYKYEDKKWANAVILNNESEVYYDGDEIPEEKIESYFVWIPRYKYKIFDMGNYEGLTTTQNKQQIIDVQFGIDTTSDSDTTCTTPMESGASGTCSVGKYMTHPAFLAFGTNGMWVGKFETGYKGANTTTEAEQNPMNETIGTPEKVIIKPNVYSWRGIQVSNAFWTSYNYKRDYNSHMMKNTEWGAVAYLQHSQYGSHESVRINNNEAYITGYAAVNEPSCGWTADNRDCNRYESTELGQVGNYTIPWNKNSSFDENKRGDCASTTGNVSGVYDMVGGAFEYVMGVMLNETNQYLCSGRDATYHSGFSGPYCNVPGSVNGVKWPDSRYYDIYSYSNYDTKYYNRRILGDATGEMGPFHEANYNNHLVQISSWYKDASHFVYYWSPWFTRGYPYLSGSASGIFTFVRMPGSATEQGSFRVVLVA